MSKNPNIILEKSNCISHRISWIVIIWHPDYSNVFILFHLLDGIAKNVVFDEDFFKNGKKLYFLHNFSGYLQYNHLMEMRAIWFKLVLGKKLYFNHCMKLIRLATKMSPYNSFVTQKYSNTLQYENSKQITKNMLLKSSITVNMKIYAQIWISHNFVSYCDVSHIFKHKPHFKYVENLPAKFQPFVKP